MHSALAQLEMCCGSLCLLLTEFKLCCWLPSQASNIPCRYVSFRACYKPTQYINLRRLCALSFEANCRRRAAALSTCSVRYISHASYKSILCVQPDLGFSLAFTCQSHVLALAIKQDFSLSGCLCLEGSTKDFEASSLKCFSVWVGIHHYCRYRSAIPSANKLPQDLLKRILDLAFPMRSMSKVDFEFVFHRKVSGKWEAA